MAHKHPGVTLMKEQPAREWIDPETGQVRRSGAIYHRARYRDPSTGKYRYETLPQTFTHEKRAYETRHKQARQLWAKLKSDNLLVDGAKHRVRPSAAPGSAPISEVIDQYFTDKPRLSKATVEQKRRSLDNFLSWCADHKIHNTDELTADALRNWRTGVESRGRRVPVKGDGEGQGSKRQTDKPRADWSIASEIAHVAAALKHLRAQREHFRHIDADDFAERLKPHKITSRKKKRPLSKQDLPRVIQACIARDAETLPNGRPRHPAVAPFFTFLLLSGLRPGEVFDLAWSAVELDEDDDGAGVIYVHASKTGVERMVELRVSPACRRLLIAMKERDGGEGKVWGLTFDEIKSAYRQIRRSTKVKHFSPQVCRVSTGSYLINSSIYERAVERRTAEQLGHDEKTARAYYWGTVRGLDQDKRSLEGVMGIEREVEQITESIQPKARARRKSA
jgi:integrase